MSAPSVRLLLKGQLVAEVPFRGPVLRIGRMKENELVINNLSVSRFHATLTREEGRIVLRDLGSENGCWVNGHRVNEAPVGPADSIQIGKHQLELLPGTGEAELDEAPLPRGRSDAWDAAHTYLVGVDTRAKMLGGPPAEDSAAGEPVIDLGDPEEPALAPVSEAAAGPGAELFGDDVPGDLGAPDLAEFDVSELEVGELPGEPPPVPEPVEAAAPAPPTGIIADEEATLLVEEVAPHAAPDLAAPATPAPPTAPLHAGVIVQRGGRLERVVPWEGDRLTLGRAADCDIMLGTAEVSRRHALLVRDGDRYEVRDLESINGSYVNGERVARRTLKVGDVIRIEDFELTFVLDREPLGEAVRPVPAAPTSQADARGLTQLGEVLDLAPFVSDESADVPNAMSFDADAGGDASAEPEAAAAGDAAPAPSAPEAISFDDPGSARAADAPEATLLFEAEPAPEALLIEDVAEAADDEKEELAPALVAPTPTVRFELAVRLEELPPALREALSSLDEADLRLPVELRMARDDK